MPVSDLSRCPSCKVPMKQHRLPGQYGSTVVVDSCFTCKALWFDQGESAQLAPDGVVELFQIVSAAGGAASSQLAERLDCPRCTSKLEARQDRVKTGQFNYSSCRSGHGRLTSYYQFLVEKQFVRNLNAAELKRLAVEVKQIKCSGCGAPVNLTTESACTYCRSPVAVFDRDAAKKAIDHYLAERGKQLPAQPNSPSGGTYPVYTQTAPTKADIALDIMWALAQFAGTAGRSRTMSSNGGNGMQGGSFPATGSANSDSGWTSDAALPSMESATAGAGDNLPSADEALGSILGNTGSSDFGNSALDQIGSLFNQSGAANNLPDLSTVTDNIDLSSIADSVDLSSVGSSVAETVADSASGLVDLVGDGIGSLLSGLFD